VLAHCTSLGAGDDDDDDDDDGRSVRAGECNSRRGDQRSTLGGATASSNRRRRCASVGDGGCVRVVPS
jgi:hypothetical protein